MPGITKEMTVNQVLKLYPKSVGIFTTFNIDACCGGNRSLEQAAREDKAVLDDLMKALDQCVI
ncbi:MAG: DUF542 domain-containing protein [Nitrospirae bacterium]|nr:DUF542 domain-containing protein [Nitrospirota bacterium]